MGKALTRLSCGQCGKGWMGERDEHHECEDVKPSVRYEEWCEGYQRELDAVNREERYGHHNS